MTDNWTIAVNATTARDVRLIDIVVPRQDFDASWRELARTLADQASGAANRR